MLPLSSVGAIITLVLESWTTQLCLYYVMVFYERVVIFTNMHRKSGLYRKCRVVKFHLFLNRLTKAYIILPANYCKNINLETSGLTSLDHERNASESYWLLIMKPVDVDREPAAPRSIPDALTSNLFILGSYHPIHSSLPLLAASDIALKHIEGEM